MTHLSPEVSAKKLNNGNCQPLLHRGIPLIPGQEEGLTGLRCNTFHLLHNLALSLAKSTQANDP
jgi:hypothetical protein